jgi:serine protease AprX
MANDKVFLGGLVLLLACSSGSGLAPRKAVTVPGGDRLGGTEQKEADIEPAVEALENDQTPSYELQLRGGAIDPLKLPTEPASVSTLRVVQYKTAVLEEYVEQLHKLGATPLDYLPYHAQLVRMTDAVAEEVAKQAYVRWVGVYRAEWRLAPGLEGPFAGEARFSLLATRDADQSALAARIEAAGGRVEAFSHHGLLEVTINASQLTLLANDDAVLSLDVARPAEPDLNIARKTSGADWAYDNLGYDGAGLRAEVMDGNVLDTHPDLKSRPTWFHGERSTSNKFHGTCTTGIVFGDGALNPLYRGLLPKAQPIFASYEKIKDRYRHTEELTQSPYFAVFQSNSWGSGLTTEYTNESAELDRILFDTDVALFQSQSNYGSRKSRPQAWSKNAISIGAFRHGNTLIESDDYWGGGASIGPASDGRIKPDLSHFYDATEAPFENGKYGDFGGTSGATPITAGHAGVFMQMWADGVFGTPTRRDFSGNSVFDFRPHMTTTKAILINTAHGLKFTGEDDDMTRVHQGWGRVDLRGLYEASDHMLVVDESDVLTQGQKRTYRFDVGANSPSLKATLVFADPPGNPAATIARVNDLSLRVIAPDGTVYRGNVGLRAGQWSSPGGQLDHRDTVENVFVQSPQPGAWWIQVLAEEINQDGHTETRALDVDYALVVTSLSSRTTTDPWTRIGHVTLYEVGYDTPGDEPVEEYVVLLNSSPTTVDLAGWSLHDFDSPTPEWRLPSIVLAPGEKATIARDALGFTNWRALRPTLTGSTCGSRTATICWSCMTTKEDSSTSSRGRPSRGRLKLTLGKPFAAQLSASTPTRRRTGQQ